MRGINQIQNLMFSYLSPEERVPAGHPLRDIKRYADEILRSLSGEFEAMYSKLGWPSVPPERLLKAQLLMALYSVRSDRMFCEMLDYNILGSVVFGYEHGRRHIGCDHLYEEP